MDSTVTSAGQAPAPAGTPAERRRAGPLIAFFCGPLGHIAIGQWGRAAAWYAAEVALVAGAFLGAFCIAPRVFWGALFALVVLRVLVVLDVVRLGRVHPLPRARLVLIVGLGVGIFYDILGLHVRAHFVEAFQIPSASMYPSIHVGDRIFVKKTVNAFQRGDVVVFRYPVDRTTEYIKRVVAVGGDVVAYRDGELSINGQPVARRPLDEACQLESGPCQMWEESMGDRRWRVAIEDQNRQNTFNVPPTTVPVGKYFLLGDNRDNSSDSRHWGTVDAALMEGMAEFVYFARADGKIDWDRINQPVR
jgi:signal peptidase I